MLYWDGDGEPSRTEAVLIRVAVLIGASVLVWALVDAAVAGRLP